MWIVPSRCRGAFHCNGAPTGICGIQVGDYWWASEAPTYNCSCESDSVRRGAINSAWLEEQRGLAADRAEEALIDRLRRAKRVRLPEGLRAEAQRAPSNTTHVDALHACARQHLQGAALAYRRPSDHMFFNLLTSERCSLRLFGIWKVGSTLISTWLSAPSSTHSSTDGTQPAEVSAASFLSTPNNRIEAPAPCDTARCGCSNHWKDHTPTALRDMKATSRTAGSRRRYIKLAKHTAPYFSVALTREPTRRLLSGV